MLDLNRLSIASGGSGDPMLLIHGFGFNKFTWRHLCSALADTFTFHAIDLPGIGGIAWTPDNFDYSLESYADLIASLIVTKDLTKLTLVGWSLGGGIALLALLRHRQELAKRVRTLCIVDGIAYPQTFPFFVGILRLPIVGRAIVGLCPPEFEAHAVLRYCYFDGSLIRADQIAEYSRLWGDTGVRRSLIATARSIDTARLSKYSAQLNSLDLQALLVWGREDRVVPLRIGQRLANELRRSQLRVIEGCGHMPHEERPSQVITAIRQFNMEAN
jgi:pimeloyl-ACP methyl ester carboxylesterase